MPEIRDDLVALLEEPRERRLRWGDIVLSHRCDIIDDSEDIREALRREPGNGVSEVIRVEVIRESLCSRSVQQHDTV